MEDLSGVVMDAMSNELPEDPFDLSHYFMQHSLGSVIESVGTIPHSASLRSHVIRAWRPFLDKTP